MTGEDATAAVIDALEALHVPYMLSGSLASNVYGVPRATQDADFVVLLAPDDLDRLRTCLGPAFQFDPQVSFETVTATTRHAINIPEVPFTVELFHLSDDPHDRERFRRRRPVEISGRGVFLPSAEDIVITKLRWAAAASRAKDRQDARNIIAVQRDHLDWGYLESWCDRHGTRPLLDELRASIPALD